jgi:hypothetical protein
LVFIYSLRESLCGDKNSQGSIRVKDNLINKVYKGKDKGIRAKATKDEAIQGKVTKGLDTKDKDKSI